MLTSQISRIDHLLPLTRELLSKTDQERIEYIQSDKWLSYPLADRILTKMEDIYNAPNQQQMPNLLIVGEPNSGKTSLALRFCSFHPQSNDRGHAPSCPVMYILAPPSPDEGRLYSEILLKIENYYFFYHKKPANKLDRVISYFKNLGTRMLVIDDIQHILCGPRKKQQAFMSALQNLSDLSQISIVLVGIEEALSVLTINPLYYPKFGIELLNRWFPNQAFINMLAAIEKSLPLAQPSNLATNSGLAREIYELSGGIHGEVWDLLSDAATVAIESGQEKITLEELQNTKFYQPFACRLLKYVLFDE